MNYKGAYDATESYSIGDVVVYTDGVAYSAIQPAAAGVTPHEERCWARVIQPLQEVVQILYSALSGVNEAIETVAASIPDNINDEAITLSTETGDYLITVDDSGDTPDLAVTLIEDEGEGD